MIIQVSLADFSIIHTLFLLPSSNYKQIFYQYIHCPKRRIIFDSFNLVLLVISSISINAFTVSIFIDRGKDLLFLFGQLFH